MAQVQEAAQFYTEEDWDTIRAKLEANADLVKEIAGEDVYEADYAQRMRKESRKRTGVELQTESSKKLKSDTREDVSVPKEKDKESVKREEEFEIKKPVLRYTKRKSLARKGLQKKPESAKSGTKEDVEAYMEERVDEPSSEEFSNGLIPQGPAPAKIVKWQIIKTGKRGAYQIIREDNTDVVYVNFQGLLNDLTRDDLKELYRLMMLKYGDNRPEEEFERVLWGDLKTMFDPPSEEDAIWKLPHQQQILNWRYFHSCSVHCLTVEAAHIYMLTEVKYPLPPRVCKAMLEKKLLGDRKDESTMSNRHKDWLVQEQTALGKDFSNPFMADNLPKILTIGLQKANQIQDFGPTLMALPNEHLMTFNQYKDAKTLFAGIQTRFVGNETTKKTQKTLLKQMYENFSSLSTESLDSTFNRLQKISTNEVILPFGVSTTNTQVSPASTQVSTANLSDDTIYAFLASQPNGSQLVYEDLEQIHEDDIEEMDLKWQLALLSMRIRSYMADDEVPTNMALMAFSDSEVHNDKTCSKTCLKSFETLKTQLDDLRIEFNKSEFNFIAIINGVRSVEENLSFTKRMSLDKLIRSQILDKTRKGVGFISYNVVPPPPTGLFSPPNLDLSYSGLEEFQQPEFEGYGPKPSKSVSEDTSNEVRESPDAPLVEELVSDDKLEKKTVFPTVAKIEFVRPKQQEKPVRKPVKYAEMYKSQSPRGNQRNWNNQKSQQLGSGPLEKVVSENNYTRVNYNYSSKKAHPSAHKNMVPRAVLMKTGPGHPQKEDQGYVDSGCSRHMTGNMSYLSDFKEFDGGYVTFRGGAKGGKITGDGPKWLFDIDVLTSINYLLVVVGTNSNDLVGMEESIGAGHSSKEIGSSQDYILMPMWKDGLLFDSSLKNASND
ncbi:hypothetical protein Tco_1457618 [Tanacetum coccineum]